MEGLPLVQEDKVINLVRQGSKVANLDIADLIAEINKEFIRAQNCMIFEQ